MLEYERTAPELSAVIPEEIYEDPNMVATAMGDIEGELAGAGLSHVIPFNTIYRQLTETVIESINQSRRAMDPEYRQSILDAGGVPEEPELQKPDTVSRTIGIFADYYFKQLRAYMSGKPEDVDPAWRLLFYTEDAKKALPGIQFLLGMNAHINYDLPQALRDSGVGEDYKPDYTVVIGKLIELTADRLAPDYIPVPDRLRVPIVGYAVRKIAEWREAAWVAGKKLLNAEQYNTGEISEGAVSINAIMSMLNNESQVSAVSIMRLGRRALRALGLVPPRLVARWAAGTAQQAPASS